MCAPFYTRGRVIQSPYEKIHKKEHQKDTRRRRANDLSNTQNQAFVKKRERVVQEKEHHHHHPVVVYVICVLWWSKKSLKVIIRRRNDAAANKNTQRETMMMMMMMWRWCTREWNPCVADVNKLTRRWWLQTRDNNNNNNNNNNLASVRGWRWCSAVFCWARPLGICACFRRRIYHNWGATMRATDVRIDARRANVFTRGKWRKSTTNTPGATNG